MLFVRVDLLNLHAIHAGFGAAVIGDNRIIDERVTLRICPSSFSRSLTTSYRRPPVEVRKKRAETKQIEMQRRTLPPFPLFSGFSLCVAQLWKCDQRIRGIELLQPVIFE